MLNATGGRDNHDRFKELCASAVAGSLAPLGVAELRLHLQECEECRDVFRQYRALTTEGLAILADACLETQVPDAWDKFSVRQRLLARIQAGEKEPLEPVTVESGRQAAGVHRRVWASPLARLALATGLMLAVAVTAYHLGRRAQAQTVFVRAPQVTVQPVQRLADEKQAVDELLAAQEQKLSKFEKDKSQKEQEIEKLRVALRAMEDRANALAANNAQSEERLQTIAQQHDALNKQLQAATQAYEKNRTELASLQAERDRTILRMASLEARVSELTSTNREQDRRLKDAEQFLSSDRDIRELMGARKLYIADVFDVDGSSRTQKPYGRVFYTQGKSLIFYAFDLDRQPKVINASTFQVWGQREGQQAAPMNLGILYMDSEANRRWVMRFDDPKQLAEIDAVFVTVEPRGGSQKPTSKPFLYALLRNEANHP